MKFEKQKTIELKDEQNQLLIEESSKSGNGRISEYARNKLKMNPVNAHNLFSFLSASMISKQQPKKYIRRERGGAAAHPS